MPHVLARRLLTHSLMATIPPIGSLAGAPLASTIVGIDGPLFAAAALALGVLVIALSVGALSARRERRRVGAGSLARTPQVAIPWAALGEGR